MAQDIKHIRDQLIDKINHIEKYDFFEVAEELYQYQKNNNSIFSKFVQSLNEKKQEIVFAPISIFKNYEVKTGNWKTDKIFESSGTTGSTTSHHYLRSEQIYLDGTVSIFESFYGPIKSHCILGLLPGYLERKGSSLVSMVDHFVKKSKYVESGFYLYDHTGLYNKLQDLKRRNIPTVLFGVSYAFLDYLEEYSLSFDQLIVIETGGMKGKRKEIPKEGLHEILKLGFGTQKIHSEYGMTELLSQAYSKNNGIFYPGNTMRIIIKEINDPRQDEKICKGGLINVIDLRNIDSCAFICTDDIGLSVDGKSFKVLGRMDYSDLRGCNLLVP